MKKEKHNEKVYPLLKANEQGIILCPFCFKKHKHGKPGGHRIAHCHKDEIIAYAIVTKNGVIYQENGYYIEYK